MKTSTLASLMVSPLAIMAAPAWLMTAYNESYPEIHGKPINAASGAFWLNNDATAVCPSYSNLPCPASNKTIISGPVYGNGSASSSTYWFMGILQPSGQQISAAGLDGSYGGLGFKYAAVGAADIGVGVWDVSRNSHPGLVLDETTVDTLSAPTIRTAPGTRNYTWMACPYPNPYPYPASLDEVNLNSPLTLHTITFGDDDSFPYCVRLEITLEPTTLAAPDYYFCEGCQWRCDNIYGDSVCAANGKPACLEPYCGAYTDATKGDRVIS